MENLNIKPFEIRKVQKIVESKETEELLECLKTLEIHAKPIGEGGNAEVLAMTEGPFSKVCLKKVKEKPQLICNNIDRENELQGKAHEAGVRTPLALISFETEKGNFFIMEKIIGCSVAEASVATSKIPSKFDSIKFIHDLEIQVEKMHNAGIYHRDLHTNNVMINEDGLPVIIDFGTATEGSGGDFTYEELALSYNPNTQKYDQIGGVFKDDKEMVQNMKGVIRSMQGAFDIYKRIDK